MDGSMKGMLEAQEIALAENCLSMAREAGAQMVRITLSKSLLELYGTLDGQLDKVTSCFDRSLNFRLFVDGRFGGFSTNRLVESEIKEFLGKAVSTVRMLAPDPCRQLPSPERTAKDAVSGNELQTCDPAYATLTSEEKLQMALDASSFERHSGDGLISEEGEYSDTISDTLVLDSNGLRCRHSETSFDYGVESTIQDAGGNKYSSYWWDSSPRLSDLGINRCSETAFARAVEQIGPKRIPSGKYNLVVDSESSSRLVTPILNALGGFAIQQKNSFLIDSLGKKIFPEWLDIIDDPRCPGQAGSKFFDSEGVATQDAAIIKGGVINEYFISTYISAKTGIPPTIEDATRPVLLPCLAPSHERPESFSRDGIMKLVGEGILVTGFNGGNSNSATGDFSFGVQGFLFKDGKIVHPIREMLVTGNMLTLWNSLLAAGDDARLCKSKLIPTLAFGNVDFSA